MTKVLLLAGGISNEHDVSMRSGDAVELALKTAGYEVNRADPSDSNFDLTYLAKNADVAFLALHGEGGEDGVLQAELEKLGKPFVGCDSKSSKLCWNKWDYREFLEPQGIQFAKGKLVSAQDLNDPMFSLPFVLKPVEGGSTLDALIARSATPEKIEEAKQLLAKYNQMLLEELVFGAEITVPVLGDEALPVIEIIPPADKEFDYENKYNGASQELCPPQNVSEEVQKRAQELAKRIHKLCGCSDMSRTDMIVADSGKLFVLETNTIPGLTDQSLFPKAAGVAGYTMAKFVDKLVKLALSRRQYPSLDNQDYRL